jgi:hypothetical protein
MGSVRRHQFLQQVFIVDAGSGRLATSGRPQFRWCRRALSGEALEQFGSGLVDRVLWHQFAAEGFCQ